MKNIRQSRVLLNAPMATFNPNHITPKMIEGVTHLRSFGVDFSLPRVDGKLQYALFSRRNAFIKFCKDHDLKVIWTVNMSTRTLLEELSYIKLLIDQGLDIAGFQMGGEFWLKKYIYGMLDEKGVTEKIRIGQYNDDTSVDYLTLLRQWLKGMIIEYSLEDYEYIMPLCEHGYTDSLQDEYRKYWNESIVNFILSRPDLNGKVSYSFHLYTGARPDNYNDQGEIEIVELNDHTFDFMQVKPPKQEGDLWNNWVVAEAGHYTEKNNMEGLAEKDEFYNRLTQALGLDDLFGIHQLYRPTHKWHTLAMYNKNGLTEVGSRFEQWLNEAKPEPYLVKVMPAYSKGQFIFWGTTELTFSDGTTHKRRLWLERRLFGIEDYGMTLSACKERIFNSRS